MTSATSRRTLLIGGVSAAGLLGLAACTTDTSSSSPASTAALAMHSRTLTLDETAWSYDATNDVYYQIGAYYVTKPQAPKYENLAVYVPGEFFTTKKNSRGLYTATINSSGTVGKYAAATAPIVFPVNTPGYAAQQPPTSYSYDDVSTYLKAGFVYVAAGMRGKDSESSTYTGNAPWGVTDLKAAVRWIRNNLGKIPGSSARITVFGMSGGGAQSAIMGASGDSDLYTPYLEAIGAAITDSEGKAISDVVGAAMCWCPITNLDWANGAYEWNMGQFATTGTRAPGTWTRRYSSDLAVAFAKYVNKLELKDSTGKLLSLEPSSSGTYLAGSYYDHLIAVIQHSLNRFLAYTTFPYTASSGMGGGMGGGAPTGHSGSSGGVPSGSAGAPSGISGEMPSGTAPSGGSGTQPTGGSAGGPPSGTSGGGSTSAGKTYKTVEAYIDYLNADITWVKYDASAKTVTVLNLEGFITSQKNATKDAGAFDGIDRGETENVVFGHGTAGAHFAPESRQLISANQSKYATLTGWTSADGASAYTTDFAKTDSLGKNATYRVDMYNPMYYLSKYYAGYRSAKVAPHWRIRTGIQQGDTANTTEIDLMLAVQNYTGNTVDFATVWGEGHTMTEETGNPTTNFINWLETAFS